MWKTEFARAVFPIIPVASYCSFWFGAPVIYPAGLPLILAVGLTFLFFLIMPLI